MKKDLHYEILEAVEKLHKEEEKKFRQRYNYHKHNLKPGRIMRFFGIHYFHIGNYLLQILFLVSLIFFYPIGIVRRIYQGIFTEKNINKKNYTIAATIYEEITNNLNPLNIKYPGPHKITD